MTSPTKIQLTVSLLFILLFIPAQVAAYRQPVSNQFMSPYCPLLANGAKNPACLHIPKSQCDYFVSKQGNNTNPGTETQPFATIQKGVDQLSAGKTLCIKGYTDGTKYSGNIVITNKNGGNNSWITIGGYEPDKRVIIEGSNYTVDGLKISQSKYVRVMALEAIKTNNAFTADISNNIDLINLKAYDNWNWGIGIPKTNGPSQKIRIEHSEIFDNVKKNVLDPNWNPNTDTVGQGGTGAQFNKVTEGAFRYNKLYRNFGEGLDIHFDSNQLIIEDNLFSENSHASFYVNHASNILYHRNLTICTGERDKWHAEYGRDNSSLGIAITLRNEQGRLFTNEDEGGNNAVINNIVMGCTTSLVVTAQTGKPGYGLKQQRSSLVANNTIIDTRQAEVKKPKPAFFLSMQNNEALFPEPIIIQNNLFKSVDPLAKILSGTAVVNFDTIKFATNITDKAPGFSKGITLVSSLPFEQTYNPTTFLGDNPKPWELSKDQLDTILRRAKLIANSPAVNAGQTNLPSDIAPEFRNRFLNLYASYLAQDYFGNTRGNNPDIGAHEFNGVLGPTFTPTPTPTNSPNATNTPTPPTNSPTSGGKIPFFDSDTDTDWLDILLFVPKYLSNKVKFDLNNDGTIDVFDFTTSINWFNRSSDTPIPTNEATPTTGQIPTNNPTPTQAPTPTDGPTPTSPPPTPTPPNIPGEIRLLEWNKPAEINHSGFLEAKPAPDFAQGNWVTPTNYAEGKLYIRAKVNSIPINQPGMRLGLCFWQGESNTPSWGEECASAEKIEGRAENEVMWVREMSQLNPIGGNKNHIDWTTDRWKYGIIIRNGSGDGEGKPVTKKAGMNWNGEDPAHWYPMDIHFTIVIVKKGQAFSGWQNYGW